MSGPSPADAAFRARLGANLARRRRAAGVSQEELGLRASLHRTEISLLERGERMPRLDTAVRIAGSLGVGLDDLVAGLAWRPGREILVPGGWEVTAADDRAGEGPAPSADGFAPTAARGGRR